uniref:ADF-H domain-containing protein n=1 Tax=Oryzias latipes TaxID=8090 RepID=A0A3P9LU47_ORYLA
MTVKMTSVAKNMIGEIYSTANNGDQSERLRFVVLEYINGQIDVTVVFRQTELDGKDVFTFFQSLLEPKRARFILYDCHFQTKDSRRRKELVLVTWIPQSAASDQLSACIILRKPFHRLLPGIKLELQLKEPVSRNYFGQQLGKDVIRVEEKDISS